MRYVIISDFDKQSVEWMLKTTRSKITRNRCKCLLLSGKRISMTQVAIEVGVSWHTVHRLLNKWDACFGYKLGVLEVAKGRGAKQKLTEFPMEGVIKRLLKIHSHDIKAVLADLDTMHNTKVCEKTLRKFIRYYNL